MSAVPETPPVVADAPEDFGLTDEDVESTELQEPDATDDVPAEGSAPAEAPDAPAPASPEAADQPTPPAAPAVSAEAPASPASTPTPYRLKADGTELPIEGITRLPNGDLVIPAKGVNQLEYSFLANRQQWRQSEKQSRDEIARLTKLADPQNNETTIRNDLILNGMIQAHERGELLDWADRFFTDLPLLKATAKAEAMERRLHAREAEIQPIQQERQWAQLEPKFGESLDAVLAEAMADPANADVDRAQLRQVLWNQRHDLFRPATPEEKQGHGADWTIDPKHFDRELERYRFFGEQLKQARAAAVIQKKNTAALAPSPAPPAPSTRSSAPAPSERVKPKTKEEFEARLEQFLQEPAL